jgi:hypothetical protein
MLLVVVAALLIGGVQGMDDFGHRHSVYRALYVFLTDALFWFSALYLTAGIVLTIEHGEQHLPGAGG